MFTLAALIVLVSGDIGHAETGLAENRAGCEDCDRQWYRCSRGSRQALQDCQGGRETDCRQRCDITSKDEQGVRDPTRFGTCLRNCVKGDACEQSYRSNANRCGASRLLCRRQSNCKG